ncbi:hypothetical protein A2U01_0090655, partial [Trifolium medium]|nr:hypothetical protein [Trifolium medium]
MKLRDTPLDEPPDANILTAWSNAPSFLRDAQMTEAPNLLSTCWSNAPSYLRGAQLTEAAPNILS